MTNWRIVSHEEAAILHGLGAKVENGFLVDGVYYWGKPMSLAKYFGTVCYVWRVAVE